MFLEIWPMFHKGTLVPAALVVGITLLASPCRILAQRGGGGGGRGMISTGGGVVGGRPDGISEKDDLKDFHRAMAVQANTEQRAAIAKVAQYTQAASDQLQAFRAALQKIPASSPSDRAAAVVQAIEKARSGNQNFLASLSSAQKSGLEDLTKKLAKADSELDRQLKVLDQIVQTKPASEQISSSAAVLDKALTGFLNEQLALGREMSILFDAAGQNVTFSLPAVTNSIIVDGQPVSIPASGVVSRTSAATPAENGPILFNLKLVADLTDLQQNVTSILRSALTRSPRCGERIEIPQATLTPLEPASLVVLRVHFERWVCPPGQQSPIEVAAGEGTLEVKLTLSVEAAVAPATEARIEPSAALHLVSEITRVDASGFVHDSLRSGDLGANLRDHIAVSLLSALRMGTDLKATLPPAPQKAAPLQKARFQDDGADQLSLVLDGQLQLSDEQTQQFAAQLKQRLSAQGTSPQ